MFRSCTNKAVSCDYGERQEEVLLVEEDVVLWTHPQVSPDGVHVGADVVAVNVSRTGGGSEKTRQYRPGEQDTYYTNK